MSSSTSYITYPLRCIERERDRFVYELMFLVNVEHRGSCQARKSCLAFGGGSFIIIAFSIASSSYFSFLCVTISLYIVKSNTYKETS